MSGWWRRSSPYLLAGLLTVSGISHFVATDSYAAVVPPPLPVPRTLVYASGLAELACGAGLVAPGTRRAAGWATAVLFVAVFPANVQMALDRDGHSPAYTVLVLARLPLQVPLIWWASAIARGRACRRSGVASAAMSENLGTDKLSGPGAGLGATGRSAEDFRPGDADKMASDYGDPGGIDTAVAQEESPKATEPGS